MYEVRKLKPDPETSAASGGEKRKASDANQKPPQPVATAMEVDVDSFKSKQTYERIR